ncbi:MAG TPA: nuclear transport factor 2 family protein [Rhodanobacter sp.]|nr:nuclear transport factor 2 family protein [Rhodanobacter sp.]
MDASRRLILPGASFVVVLPDGTVKIEPDTGYLEALGKHKEVFRERIWEAQVMVQGNLAQVWAPYDFHLDGKLSHCGIDSFSLVRNADGWRVVGVSYTVQKVGCAPSPLGSVE